MPLDSLLKSTSAQSALSGFLGGAAGGTVMSALTNKKSAQKLLKTGGLVALGGVAWHAFQRYRDYSSSAAASVDVEQPLPAAGLAASEPVNSRVAGNHLIRAMIGAAYADGHLTQQEQTKIWQRALEQGLAGPALTELEHMLKEPPSLDEIVRDMSTLDEKLEIYAASLLAIDEGCSAGKKHLKNLAAALQLPQPLVDAVHRSASA
jgi:uncharacterized membrane protein YebE (DUF533 family)